MKNILIILFLTLFFGAEAQTPFSVIESIDANNISAATLVHGDMWWNPVTGKAQCNFPNGTAKNIGFAASLWLSGYDDAGQLHVAAQTYRQDGNDYWPGPLDGSGNLDYATSEKWAKIWKVTRDEVNAHRGNTSWTLTNTPESVLKWPGKGNAYAMGKDNAPLSVTSDLAPFVDRNGDGLYQPLNGEYPDFRGEQALWWIFSDNGPTHGQTNGKPLKVEVHAMAYAYKRGTLIDNVVYYNYTMTNRSTDKYHDFRFALWEDADLGYYLDDHVCFDSGRRMGITYNAVNNDGGSAGNPPNSYGLYPPAVGVTMVALPGDIGTSYAPPGCFIYYNNDFTIIGNPSVDTEFNHYMHARFRNGNRIQIAGKDVDYMSDCDVPDTSIWSKCSPGFTPTDRRFILASNDFTLNPGESKQVLMALVVSDSAGGCPNVDLSGLKEVADTAWHVYHNPPPAIFVPNVSGAENNIRIHPNPAHDKLYIETAGKEMAISIYNVLGQKTGVAALNSNTGAIDISIFPTGVYFVRYESNEVSGATMFTKE